MNIDAAGLGRFQDRLRQDQAIGRYNREIGVQSQQTLLLFGTAQSPGSAHLYSLRLRSLMYRRLAFALAAARGARRLRINRNHLMSCRDQRIEARHREVRRSHENNAQLTNLRSP